MDLSSIGIGSLFRTGVTAMVDSMGSTFPKAAVAALEDKSQDKVHLAKVCLLTEGPEVFWKTVVGSVFVKVMRTIAPWLPEQFANLPGEMLGAFIHWLTSSHHSIDTEAQRAANGSSKPKLIEKFFDNCIKQPIDFGLKIVGLDSNEKNVNFIRFGLIQAGLIAGGAYVLKGAEEENIPGMNLDYEDPWYVSFFKTAGYTAFEQIAHITSQTMRYYINYKEEFGGKENKFSKDVLAKAFANVINERIFPGNIPSAISGCLSTLFLGRFIPKSLAGAIGEAPMKGFERILTLHRRRSTKHVYDENSSNHRAPNFRGHDKPWLMNILNTADSVFDPIRNFVVEKVVARVFKPENMSQEDYAKELKSTYDLREDLLKRKTEKQKAEPHFSMSA